MGDQDISARQARIWFWGLFALAVALRVWTFRPFAVHHPDEVYQYLEQAHRLITGNGVVPWEYRLGMRSWLPPLLLSLPMRLGDAIAPQSLLSVALARGFVAIIALAPIFAAFAIGSRISRLHGLVAAAVMAIWFENIYFSGHILMEVMAVALFLPAVALIKPGVSRRTLFIGGALLALAGLLRFHYAPVLGLFAAITLGKRWRDWVPLIAGGLVVMAISALVDVGMGQAPFGWILVNFQENVIKGGANRFGVSGPLAYFQMLFLRWGPAAPLLLALPVLVARRFPGLFWAAIANFLIHMAIGHKEYRFVWLTTQTLLLLSALASVDVMTDALRRWDAGQKQRRAAMLMLVAGWAVLSAALSTYDRIWPNWNRFGARTAAVADAGRVRGLCGVAIHDFDYWSAAYAYLKRDVPLYFPWRRGSADSFKVLAANAPAYNVIVAFEDSRRNMPTGYRPVRCENDGNERICVYRRDGGCEPDGAESELLQTVIARNHL
ncbi:hypothetical protein LZ496_06820 [Sphingomonas sp. NSE70-1]|uniref:Alg9-like mannosyltransferase family protein n=1 Tax=Sphingomonas caseinilyticus TaxID=2908205 RepID=A0ABT0RU02_9SPHN|nr:hypothetical protein [Sphingomonas caseinilyticus]MCL6698495.1 hypothetical protein [Sphingomonas caseinilyticus]